MPAEKSLTKTGRWTIDSSGERGLLSKDGGILVWPRWSSFGRDPSAPEKRIEAMSPSFHHLQTRFLRSCGIVVVLALMALGSFQSAQASCGDWLVGHDMSAHAPEMNAVEAEATATAKPAQPLRRRPCHGPSCGRAPVAPLAPSEATSPPDLERAAVLSNLAPVVASTAGAWLALDEPLLIPAVSGPPERPPRVG